MGVFESVFSRRAADGSPERLFGRTTGRINPEVAETWKKYDLRLMLESGWSTLGPRLAGKLHVHVASEDTFRLERHSCPVARADATGDWSGRRGAGRDRAHPAGFLATILTCGTGGPPQSPRASSARPAGVIAFGASTRNALGEVLNPSCSRLPVRGLP
jgi:hypothetical protein